MEAALRTAPLPDHRVPIPTRVDFQATRGLNGVKEGKVNIAGNEVRFAVAHGLGNSRPC